MSKTLPPSHSTTLDHRLLVGIASGVLILHIIPTLMGGYGYFIDELYYIACARRLDFGYVDHPPLAPILLRLQTSLFGTSLISVRFLPAVAGAITAYVTGWLAWFFGGDRWAQGFAAICVSLAAAFLVFSDFFSMNSFEPLFWTLAIAIVLVMIRRDEPRLWLAFGVVAGLGLQNKHTMVLIGFAVIVGLLLSPSRRLLWSGWLWLGGLIALVLFLPNLLWQMENGFPSLEFYRNATLYKNLPSTPVKVLLNQALFMNPVLAPVWLAGCWFLVARRAFRPAAIAYLLLLSILVASGSSRPDRISGLYPTLLAAGAVWWEQLFARLALPRLRWAALVGALTGGLALAPLFLPLLPPSQLARYAAWLGLDTRIEQGDGKRAELPQWLADRFGWEELVSQVTDIVRALPPEERRRAVIIAPSYGHAGALELLGEPGLPPVMAAHNTYYIWGRPHAAGLAESVAIVIGSDRDSLDHSFADVRQVDVYRCDYCTQWRNDMPIYVARRPKLTASEFERAWENSKHYE